MPGGPQRMGNNKLTQKLWQSLFVGCLTGLTLMGQLGDKGQGSGFLATILRGSGEEDTGRLANQGARRPHACRRMNCGDKGPSSEKSNNRDGGSSLD